MPEPDNYSSRRYLQAKKSVDARALNQRVWTQFIQRLSGINDSTVQILEVGGGIGATVKRMVEALEPRSIDHLQYTFVDIIPEHVQAASERLHQWAEQREYDVSGRDPQVWTSGPLTLKLRFVTADLFDLANVLDGESYDAVVAQAVLDLLSIPKVFCALRPRLRKRGLWYLPIHYDGVTAFHPPVDPALDAQIERLYHESMNGGDQEGGRAGAHCGRRLLTHLHESPARLLEAGSSDWVVFPRSGSYLEDEAYFLHHILHFVETELSGASALDPEAFEEWTAARRRQVEEGALIYIAHQLDVLAQKSNPP